MQLRILENCRDSKVSDNGSKKKVAADNLQSARYEFKYLVSEETARRVQQYTKSYLTPDKFTVGNEHIGYSVHSLYLDSRDLHTYDAVVNGAKNRFKLRLRFYDDDVDKPVFFEIKRRVNLVILKQRAAVKRKAVANLLTGKAPDYSDLFVDNEKNFKALFNFCRLRDKIDAQPSAYTSYMREGYENPESNVSRVTLDRRLRAGRYNGQLTIRDLEKWATPEMGGVVLELKFTDQFPNWMHTLVQAFDITRGSFPKYVKCVTLLNGKESPETGMQVPKSSLLDVANE